MDGWPPAPRLVSALPCPARQQFVRRHLQQRLPLVYRRDISIIPFCNIPVAKQLWPVTSLAGPRRLDTCMSLTGSVIVLATGLAIHPVRVRFAARLQARLHVSPCRGGWLHPQPPPIHLLAAAPSPSPPPPLQSTSLYLLRAPGRRLSLTVCQSTHSSRAVDAARQRTDPRVSWGHFMPGWTS